ncbi:hypothetical protein RAS2_05330 [Phycisphaerae bacterium RAS2]|nr:hypothetical protein RAS2_05330 [Phycisphaerae bacterium RAS2]
MGSSLSRLIVGFFLVAASGVDSRAFGDLIVEQVLIRDRVTPSGSFSESQQYFVEFPPSPNAIAFSQAATIPPSYSSGTYDVSWSGEVAHFQSTIDHRLQGFRGGLSSSGGIRVRPAVDSIVTLSGTWTYNHYPALLGTTSFHLQAGAVGSGSDLWSDSGTGGTGHLLPPFGTFNLSGSALLQAGVLYSLGYSITTSSFDAPPASALWLGNGFIDITVNPVPEPATAALVGPATISLIRRRNGSLTPRCQKQR